MQYTIVKYGRGTARVIHPREKIYTTHRRAQIYGNCREPSPCGGGWVALPFWSRGESIIYLTGEEYAAWMGVKA